MRLMGQTLLQVREEQYPKAFRRRGLRYSSSVSKARNIRKYLLSLLLWCNWAL